MAYKTVSVKNQKCFLYKGVNVYHTYKDDDVDNGPHTYVFTSHPYGGIDGDFVVDVRDLPGISTRLDTERPPYMDMNSNPKLAKAWKEWMEKTEPAIIKEALKTAIDAGTMIAAD